MTPTCRFCAAPLVHTFVDLGMSPLANSYIAEDARDEMEPFYPLRAYVCTACWLVQLEEFESPANIFTDYAYFSSFSESWLTHAEAYVEMAKRRFGLGSSSLVIEVASNDGYLLQYFHARGVPVLGVEPAANVASVAAARVIPTLVRFFGEGLAQELAAEGRSADLLIGNNVLAHVPDVNDFLRGARRVLKPDGIMTMEFPHLQRLVEQTQFDTIYHEHFSYFSFLTADRIFARHGLVIFDVEEVTTHGGSLRVYARRAEHAALVPTEATHALRAREIALGYSDLALYRAFAERVKRTKRQLLAFLIEAKEAGRSIVGYGAPAKGNTLLNYCGVRTDFIDYTVDRNPEKQGRYLPGTRIPIHSPEKIRETRPDYVLVLPWNLRDEIAEQMAHVREWGGAFVVPIPTLQRF